MTNQSIRKFFKDVHPKIQNPYIIVLYTGWLPSPEIFDDPKIIAFFCTDPGPLDFAHTTRYDAPYPYTPIKHKKLYRIPLGIYRAKRLFDTYQKIEDIFIKMRAIPKKNLVHMNFKRHPGNDLRHSVYENFKNKSWVKDCCLTSKPFEKYLEDMAECKFSLSPQGDMNDCYRHWEAILTGVVPIIQRTSMDEMFEELPVLIVDTWSEITEEFLNKKYDEIMSKSYNFEKLYMKYWCDKIKTVKDNFLESYYATT